MRSPNIVNHEDYRRDKFNPVFDIITGEFDNNFKELSLSLDYVIKKFYVDSRTSEGVTNAKILKLFSITGEKVSGIDDFVSPFKKSTGLVYLLLGKKGLGKTTLVYNFAYKSQKGKVEGIDHNDCMIYLDLKNLRYDNQFKQNLPQSLIELIFDTIEKDSHRFSKFFKNPSYTRKLHKIYKVKKNNEDVVTRVYDNKVEAVNYLFDWLKNKDTNVFVLVDNLDDFDKYSIRSIFDLCYKFKESFAVKCILTLRDWWTPNMLNATDRISCSKHLMKPDIYSIIKKRIYNVDHSKLQGELTFTYDSIHQITLNTKDLLDIFNKIVVELTSKKYAPLFEKILRMSNFNIRELLVNIYHFFHSSYLISSPIFINIIAEKIRSIDPTAAIDPARPLRFHDFLQNMMAVHSLCYDTKDSEIFNIFHHDYPYENGPCYKNLLIFPRMLQFLYSSNRAFAVREVVHVMDRIGYEGKAALDAIIVLLNNALIESTHGIDINEDNDIRISAKGEIYLKEIMTEYTYLVFVNDAVPMEKKYKVDVVEKFGDEEIVILKGSLHAKNRSVDLFIDFIKKNEKEEFSGCKSKYQSTLMRIRGDKQISMAMVESYELTKSRMIVHGKKRTTKAITSYKVSN